MASDKLIFLVLFSLCIQNTFANRIRIIEVLTSDCEDCGMSAFGELSIKVTVFVKITICHCHKSL